MGRINKEAAAAKINPLLLASARVGSWKALDFLFRWEDAQNPPMMIPTEEFLGFLARASAAYDVEEGAARNGDIEEGVIADSDTAVQAVPGARDVEEGVTCDEDTAPLDEPAAHGVEEGFTPDGDTPLLAVSPARDAEEGFIQQPQELLKGVTRDGDTALHAAASNGDGPNFLNYAGMVCRRDRSLLFAQNHNDDTPLHCAARAGNSNMVSLLIRLAGPGSEGPDGMLTLLRMQNKHHETALHEAVRIEDGRLLGPEDRDVLFQADQASVEKIGVFVDQQEGINIVKRLMLADPQLANYPADGVSPLYLAILLQKSTIALTLYFLSGGKILSYFGANGQNALHVAVLRDTDRVMIELLLDWNKSLTAQVDKDGSTPLHFVRFLSGSTWTLEKVFKANPVALYQADKNGVFPIHVAAFVGARDAVYFFLRTCPDSAGLRDGKGKTFLHVAVKKTKLDIVSDACKNPSLAWILNMQDSDGNTALHLAIQAGRLRMFCALFGNREVNLNLTNNQGETPHDLSRSKLPRGMGYAWNSENRINHALKFVGANHGARRWDKNEEKYSRRPKHEHENEELERVKDATQTFILASVLIATMAFSATFAFPGGYKADDHQNGGTPTLAGRYIFDAFITATTLAFICSSLATVGFMFAGIPMFNLITRKIYLTNSVPFMASSLTCLCIAFVLAVYMVLAPVAHKTAVVVCVITSPVSLCVHMESFLITAILARPLFIRKGLKLVLIQSAILIGSVLWPFIVTFGWAGLARIRHHR